MIQNSQSLLGLWSLIKSMPSQEKRLFIKKYGNSSPAIYLKLFEHLNCEEAPSETMVLQALNPELTRNNLAYTKYYLQNKILDFLSNSEPEKQPYHLLLLRQIALIKKLFLRNQTTIANSLLRQCHKYAKRIENYTAIKILEVEFAHLNLMYDVHKKSIIPEQPNLDIDFYTHILKLQRLYFQCLALLKKYQFCLDCISPKDLNVYLSNPLLEIISEDSFIANHYKTISKSILLFLSGDIQNAYEELNKILVLWHLQDELISEYSQEFLHAQTLFSYVALVQRKYREIEKNLHENSNKNIGFSLNRYHFKIFKTIILTKIAEEESEQKTLKKRLEKLKIYTDTFREHISPVLRMSLLQSLVTGYFILGKTDEAESHCRQVISESAGSKHAGLQRIMHLFLLVICYQKQNEYIFRNQYEICYQFLYRNRLLSGFEKLILQSMRKTFPFRKTSEKIKLIENCIERLRQIDNLSKKEIITFFNFEEWLQSVIQGKPYGEWKLSYLKEKGQIN